MRHLVPLLLFGILPAAHADPQLVAQLGHADFHTREAAGKKLLAIGKPAIPALEAGCESADPEVARRSADLLAAVKHKLDADAALAPTLVELPAGDTTVQKVFDAIEKQTKYKLAVNDPKLLSQKVTLKGGKVPFWEAVDRVCAATKLEVASSAVGPLPKYSDFVYDQMPQAGTVQLQAGTGVVRTAVCGAVLLQVLPPTKDELANHTPAQYPLVVRAFPEPRLKWQSLSDVVFVEGADPTGRALRPAAPPPPVYEHRYSDFRGGKRLRRSPTGLTEGTTRGTLLLSAGPDDPTELAAVTGLVRFGVWMPPAELAVVKLTDGKTDGPHGTTISVSVLGPIANDPDVTQLAVKHRWLPGRVRPEAMSGGGGEVWFENMNGKLVPVKAAAERSGPTPDRYGIVVLDAAGKGLSATSTSTRIDQETEHLRTYTTLDGKYLMKGKPAAVAFHAARVIDLSVPFTVKGLPLAAGTGTDERWTELERK